MTPQCKTVYHYTKEPLITNKRALVKLQITSGTSSKKKPKGEKDKIKCVVVGDKAVGKTSLVVSYSNDRFPTEYTPTAYDNYNVVVQVDGKPIRVELCDTAGEDEFTPLRSLCYPGTDVFLLCFSLVRPSSFRSASHRWADELSKMNAPVVLVGTQADLLGNRDVLRHLTQMGQRPVDSSSVRILAERMNAPYVETSAKTCAQLKEAFDEAIYLALRKNAKKKKLWRRLCCL